MRRIAVTALALVACQSAPSSPDRAVTQSSSAPSAAAPLQAPSAAAPAPSTRASHVDWQRAFDLDGDGRNDTIDVDFSEGAHCCYRISVTLTRTGETTKLPFQLDGGYPQGLDLSRPDHFDVRKIDAPLPEIVMEIETYDGKPSPLPKEWKQLYGFSTHHIAVGFPGGKLRVRDVPGVDGK